MAIINVPKKQGNVIITLCSYTTHKMHQASAKCGVLSFHPFHIHVKVIITGQK